MGACETRRRTCVDRARSGGALPTRGLLGSAAQHLGVISFASPETRQQPAGQPAGVQRPGAHGTREGEGGAHPGARGRHDQVGAEIRGGERHPPLRHERRGHRRRREVRPGHRTAWKTQWREAQGVRRGSRVHPREWDRLKIIAKWLYC